MVAGDIDPVSNVALDDESPVMIGYRPHGSNGGSRWRSGLLSDALLSEGWRSRTRQSWGPSTLKVVPPRAMGEKW